MLKDDLVALTDAAIAAEKSDGVAEATALMAEVTAACEARANKGLRSAAFPEPTDKAAFLSKGGALALQEALLAEGLNVRVIPYKDTFFYLDIHW